MARGFIGALAVLKKPRKKRPGVHSKNASKGQNGYKNAYRGQGR